MLRQAVPMALSFLNMSSLPTTDAMLRYIHLSPTSLREKPYHFSGPLDAEDEKARTNIAFEEHIVPMTDLRTEIDKLDLTTHGFQIKFKPYPDYSGLTEPKGLETYMNSIVQALKEDLNAENVFCYDYRVASFHPTIIPTLISVPHSFERAAPKYQMLWKK